jgi:hypothetical protein
MMCEVFSLDEKFGRRRRKVYLRMTELISQIREFLKG